LRINYTLFSKITLFTKRRTQYDRGTLTARASPACSFSIFDHDATWSRVIGYVMATVGYMH